MREQTGASVSAAPTTQDVGSGVLFIITLSSSTTPMALEVPSLAELAGLAVFRSRKVEDGRDRFRLHLGYFESPDAAEAVLPVIREHFPAAWIGPAPNSGMGSLDDTSVAQFKFIKAPRTIKSDGRTSTRLRALTAGSTPAVSGPAPSFATPVPPAQSQPAATRAAARAPAASPAQSKPVARAATPATASTPASIPAKPVAAAASASTMAPREVLSLLETPAAPAADRHASMPPRERAAVIGAIQRFAVQLVWSTEPVNLNEVPKLAIFDAYTLYKVQVDRAGRRWYGLRLGFFGDPVSARQVSLYARSDFSAAAVVPVSDRECDRAAQAAVKELPQAPLVSRPPDEMQLVDVPRTPATSVMSLLDGKPPSAHSRKPGAAKSSGTVARTPDSKPAAKGTAATSAKAPAQTEPAKPEKTRRLRSTAEMAADLVSEPQFELDGQDDPLNDTGVRHLAVTVVKKGKIGKLLKRGSRGR